MTRMASPTLAPERRVDLAPIGLAEEEDVDEDSLPGPLIFPPTMSTSKGSASSRSPA